MKNGSLALGNCRVPEASCGIVCIILCLAVFIQFQSVTDTLTQTHTDTHKHVMTAYTVIPQCHMVILQFTNILQCKLWQTKNCRSHKRSHKMLVLVSHIG